MDWHWYNIPRWHQCILIAGSPTNHTCKFQDDRSRRAKSPLKRGTDTLDAADDRPFKKRRLASHDEANMGSTWPEISGIQDALEKIAAEAREDRQAINDTLQKLLHEIQQRLWAYVRYSDLYLLLCSASPS